MRRDRRFAGSFDETVQRVDSVDDAHRSDADRRSTAVVHDGNSCRVACLVKLPERRDAGVHALRAAEHFTPDALVSDAPIADDGPRNGDRAFRVVGGLTDPPLVLRVAGVARNDFTRGALKTADAIGYHFLMPSSESISVCLPMASPVAMPIRQPRTRSAVVCVTESCSGYGTDPSWCAIAWLRDG